MSKQGRNILNILYNEDVITLADIQEFLDSKKSSKIKSKTIVKEKKLPNIEPTYDPCGGGGGRSRC